MGHVAVRVVSVLVSATRRASVGDATQQVAVVRIRQPLLWGCRVLPVSGQGQGITVPVISDGALTESIRVVNHKYIDINATKDCLSFQFIFDIFHLNIPIKSR